MKITNKLVIKVLRNITLVLFLIALAKKIHSIYKYGGPKKPELKNESDDETNEKEPLEEEKLAEPEDGCSTEGSCNG